MLDSYRLSVLLSVNTPGSFSALLGEEGNIQKGPTDSGPAETEVEVRAGSSVFDRDCPGQVGITCRKKAAELCSPLKCYTAKAQLKPARGAAKDNLGAALFGCHLVLLLRHSESRHWHWVKEDTLCTSHAERGAIASAVHIFLTSPTDACTALLWGCSRLQWQAVYSPHIVSPSHPLPGDSKQRRFCSYPNAAG